MDLLSNSDVVIVLLKTNGERDRRPNFVILFFFLVSRALIFSGWVMVVWRRKSCLGPDEISFFVFLV